MGKLISSYQSPFDRGAKDAYYGRPRKPNYVSPEGIKVPVFGMSLNAQEEYHRGYDEKPYGDKDYGVDID